MASRSDTWPCRIWQHDGKEWMALHPILLAIRHELEAEGVQHGLSDVLDRHGEYVTAGCLPATVNRVALEIDEQQHANGYTGP